MGSELVDSAPHPSLSETFHQHFPHYLSIGMTYDQYWNDDATLVKDYHKAHELKRSAKNEELWLQGLYIYEALLDVAPILNAFAKAGTKPSEYRNHPLPITKDEIRRHEERLAHEKRQRLKVIMEAWSASLDLPQTTKEVTDDGLRN